MILKRWITVAALMCLCAAVLTPLLAAQSLISGDLTGTVVDPSGAVLAGASVAIRNNATGATRATTTSSNGTYRFSLLTPGTYTFSVTVTGFSKSEALSTVSLGQTTISDLKMSLGTSSQTVEVSSVAFE